MESENPFDAVRSMMADNLEKVGSATKNYLDLLQKNMLSLPNANEDQISGFRAYIERQVAANHSRVSKLIGAKDFQEAMQIQVEETTPVSNESRRQRYDAAYGQHCKIVQTFSGLRAGEFWDYDRSARSRRSE